jgi:hypothetical protein
MLRRGRSGQQLLNLREPDHMGALPCGAQSVLPPILERVQPRLYVGDIAIDGIEDFGFLRSDAAQNRLDRFGCGGDPEDETARVRR